MIRSSNWIHTYTGGRFWPMDPKPEDVCIEDIAHALSMLCRYNGHCTRFYSVAEHCYLVSLEVERLAPADRDQQLDALLHDASEAYLGDVPRPIKPLLIGYKAAEQAVEMAIASAFGRDHWGTCTPLIADIDRRIVVDEVAAIMSDPPDQWPRQLGEPLGVAIETMSPREAEERFLERFYFLQQQLQPTQ